MKTAAKSMAGSQRGRTNASGIPLPEGVPQELAGHLAAGVISADDLAAAAMLVGMARRDDPAVAPGRWAWLGMCLAIRAPRAGHTCVNLGDPWSSDVDADPAAGDELECPDAKTWIEELDSAGGLVGPPGTRAPFIRDGERLYLARSFHEESAIAEQLVGPTAANVEILLGGPGTGKTTRVATRLISLFRENPDAQISLAAPTGKAAARMAEALRLRLHDENAPPEVKDAPQEARDAVAKVRPLTIHKLLGYRPRGTPRYKACATSRLAAGTVIVDEASMLSSSLMHRLLDALGADTRLLLVGDPDQLASVDAGTVLGDIAKAAATSPGSGLADRTEKLTIRHRFGPRIGGLADAILAGGGAGAARAFDILAGRWTPAPDPRNTKPDDPTSIDWIQPGSDAFKKLVEVVVAHAHRLRDLTKRALVEDALAAQKELQVLCAHRAGANGVAGWNARVEGRLGIAYGTPWYSGRPLMVTRNNPALDLFNGDVGLVVVNPADGLRYLALPKADGPPKLVSVTRLENVDTVHALTIHKSQGSEYSHAVVVLPERASRIVTKELLYTAVTRATDKVTLVGSREVIETAIKTPIRRATGLADRLKGG